MAKVVGKTQDLRQICSAVLVDPVKDHKSVVQ